MGRGGHNRKTLAQHIADGTYRADRHGHYVESDEATLREMKGEMYQSFKAITRELGNLDMVEDVGKYKMLSDTRIALIKAFHAVAKMPVEDKKTGAESDKDGFKD